MHELDEHSGDIAARDLPVGDCQTKADPSRSGGVGQGAGADDGPVELGPGDMDVGLALDLHVVLELRRHAAIPPRIREGRHVQEAAYARDRGRGGRKDDAVPVDEIHLPRAALGRTRGEHDGVHAAETKGELFDADRGQIASDRLDTGGVQGTDLLRVAVQTDRIIAPLGELARHTRADAASRADDEDAGHRVSCKVQS